MHDIILFLDWKFNLLPSLSCRILEYVKNGTQDQVVDPTPERKWLRLKACHMGWVIHDDPELIIQDHDSYLVIGNYGSDSNGWCQSLINLPKISIACIETFYEKSIGTVMHKGTTIKKHFRRGEQFIKERFIDTDHVFTKLNEKYFFIKGICSASMSNKERWVSIALNRDNGEIAYAFCECPSGNGGQCSHCYAMMKLAAQWSLDQLEEIPSLPCTSKPCQWSVKKGKGRIDKVSTVELMLKSQRYKDDPESKRPRASGICSKMYESRAGAAQFLDSERLEKFLDDLRSENPAIPALSLIQNTNYNCPVPTKFGPMPLGSPVAFHFAHLPHGFKVYTTIDAQDAPQTAEATIGYPLLPITPVESYIDECVCNVADEKQIAVLDSLKVSSEKSNEIEAATIDHQKNRLWMTERRLRFTASKCNDLIRMKTPVSFQRLAEKLLQHDVDQPNTYVRRKLDHGIYYEPFALTAYENYMKLNNRPVTVSNCGLWISPENFTFAATPDGKVSDNQERNSFGIIEVKCPEEYKEFDPADAAVAVKGFCVVREEESFKLRKDCGYYDQIQFQMGVTGAPWCDFIVYTFKGMVIDRVHFDKDHFKELIERVSEFYFKYFLPLASTV